VDTDDLSEMAYHVIRLAASTHDALKAEIGASATYYQNEEDFLNGAKDYIKEISENPENYLDSWDIIDQVENDSFRKGLRELIDHLEQTLQTPLEERGKIGI
jgi:hypothetical protein